MICGWPIITAQNRIMIALFSSTQAKAGLMVQAAILTWTEPKPKPEETKPAAPAEPKETVYTVQRGDTLSGIAAKYGTTYTALAEYNGIKNPDIIFAGQKIKIPGSNAAAKKDITEGDIVKIKKGANDYYGNSLASFVYERKYLALEVVRDRVVVSYDGIVVAAVNKKDLILA